MSDKKGERRRRRPASTKGRNASTATSEASPGRHSGRLLSALGAVALLVFGSFATPVGQKLIDWMFPSAGRLDQVDMVVGYGKSPDGDSRPPVRLDLKVQNGGTARVVTKDVRLRLDDRLTLKVCNTQGELSVTHTYEVILPTDMKKGESVRHELDQEVAADEADRFVIEVQNPPIGLMDEVTLYRLDVLIDTNGHPAVLDMGSAIMSLPATPDNNDAAWYWSAQYATGERSLSWLGEQQQPVEECMKANSRALQQFLSKPGKRPEELAKIQADLR